MENKRGRPGPFLPQWDYKFSEEPNLELQITKEIPLHSPWLTLWYSFISEIIIGLFFYENNTLIGPVTSSVYGEKHHQLLNNVVIPALQQRQCLDKTIFMQDGRHRMHTSLCGYSSRDDRNSPLKESLDTAFQLHAHLGPTILSF